MTVVRDQLNLTRKSSHWRLLHVEWLLPNYRPRPHAYCRNHVIYDNRTVNITDLIMLVDFFLIYAYHRAIHFTKWWTSQNSSLSQDLSFTKRWTSPSCRVQQITDFADLYVYLKSKSLSTDSRFMNTELWLPKEDSCIMTTEKLLPKYDSWFMISSNFDFAELWT